MDFIHIPKGSRTFQALYASLQSNENVSQYLLIAADTTFDALQFGVADLSELVLRHGNDSVALGDEMAAVTYKEAVVTRERLQDL